MTAPSRSFHTDFGRFYAHPSAKIPSAMGKQTMGDGPTSPKPSITNILKMQHEEFLAPWFAKRVAEEAIVNKAKYDYVASKFGPEVAIGQLKAIVNQSNEAAAVGDEVHAAIDDYSRGLGMPEEFEHNQSKAMWAQALKFLEHPDVEIVRSEFTVWSYTHGYAGTGDLMARIHNKLWIIDTKTGQRVYPKAAMQLAALKGADVIIEDDGAESDMPDEPIYLGVLHVRPRSARLQQVATPTEAWETFLALKRVFDWHRLTEAKAISPKFSMDL